MARRPSGWHRKTRHEGPTIAARGGAAQVVPGRGSLTVRVHATARAAIAAGIPAAVVRLLFQRRRGKDVCDGTCSVVFDETHVWCESIDCDEDYCECHLFEMWFDKNGPHDEDRGYPGPEWKYRRKPNRFYRCICKPKAIAKPTPKPKPKPKPRPPQPFHDPT